MKIHMEIDLTPEELKALLGWPDISLMQTKHADAASEESLDHALKDNIKQSMNSMNQIQGLFVDAFSEAIKDMRRNPGKDD
jgi:hypothetical protein